MLDNIFYFSQNETPKCEGWVCPYLGKAIHCSVERLAGESAKSWFVRMDFSCFFLPLFQLLLILSLVLWPDH
jgi:hypothetical protein